jgi:hypothetical protein
MELRLARLEAYLARLVVRIDPTVSHAQVMETLRS